MFTDNDSTSDVVELGVSDFDKASLVDALDSSTSTNASTDLDGTFNSSDLNLFEGKLKIANVIMIIMGIIMERYM